MEEGTERGVHVVAPYGERYDEVLTAEALTFLSQLHEEFEGRRQELLADRRTRWERIATGEDPDFLAETKDLRSDRDWRVAPLAPGLHVQHHQELPYPPRTVRLPGSLRCHDDDAVHAGVHRIAGADLSPSRCTCDRWHGGVRARSA
jgi:malate synthase